VDWRAGHVLAFSSKPVVYGIMAAHDVGVPGRSAMITGIGSALSGGGDRRSQAARWSLEWLYRRSLRHANVVFFQNGDDEALFRSRSLIAHDQQVVRINGSGVDLDHFAVAPLPRPPIVFLMICRLIRDKGVLEYVEAARIVRGLRPDSRVRLLGPLDVNPTAVTERQLALWRDEGIIEYLGSADDVRPALSAAQVCVLPSYHEGMPRVVLEAMSMGRAIITTDVPGCRETVRHGENGYLVPARDPRALAERMLDMIDHPDRLEEMGRASRSMAQDRFDVREVNRVIMDALGLSVATPVTREER
jgi:glycosyltransferase involved in cell wall biosynthesis